MRKAKNIEISADIVLGDNGDIAVAIEPSNGRRLKPDYFSFDSKNEQLILVTTANDKILLGAIDGEMIEAIKKLKSLVLVQLTEDGAAAHAEETSLRIG